MCDGHVDARAIGQKHNAPDGWWHDAFDTLEELRADGLLDLSSGTVRMSAKGRPLVRIAASAFDAYLQDSSARHSVSV